MSEKISSPQDLFKLRDRARSQVELRSGPKETQVVVHMGTCGIAAGARDLIDELISQLDQRSVQTVTVRHSGCIGLCDQEPMLTYTDKEGHNFLYVKLTRDKVKKFVEGHIVSGTPVIADILGALPPSNSAEYRGGARAPSASNSAGYRGRPTKGDAK